jgi:hypothetical protein
MMKNASQMFLRFFGLLLCWICLASSPFLSGLGQVTRSFLALALGEIFNPAQRIRVEGFEHVTTAGARQVLDKIEL